MRKTLGFVLCLMVGVCTLSGCIEEYEADISVEYSDLLVVQGTICSGKMNKFILSRTQALNSSYMPRMVMGARVSVRGSDGSQYTAQETDDYYTCQIGALDPDVEYFLHIETDGEVYESEPQKPLPTEKIAEVRGVQETPESKIDVLVTPEAPFDPGKANYYSWTYDETWEVHPDYTTVIYFDTKKMEPVYDPNQFPVCGWKNAISSTILVGASLSYEGQHIQRLKLYDIDRGNERMYYRYSGLVHQRAISKAEYEYELARQQAGFEMGGLFTPLPSALPTNIRCLTSHKHVIGFVGCSLNTSEYRFFLTHVGYSIDRPYPKDARRWLNDCNEADCSRMVREEHMFLCEWIDERYKPAGVLRTAWAYDYQLDVRLRGAYAEEPDFWSLQENVSY
ncbi:MAG: DUF4249 domain-containing protein [Prevotella sp.]|nr:DUF4249 domain-containing protein [Prevotella sp.]